MFGEKFWKIPTECVDVLVADLRRRISTAIVFASGQILASMDPHGEKNHCSDSASWTTLASQLEYATVGQNL